MCNYFYNNKIYFKNDVKLKHIFTYYLFLKLLANGAQKVKIRLKNLNLNLSSDCKAVLYR